MIILRSFARSALSLVGPSCSAYIWKRSYSNELNSPQPFQLEHVRQRLNFTVPLMFRQRLDYTFYSKNVEHHNHVYVRYRTRGLQNLMKQMGLISVVGQVICPHIEMEALSIMPLPQDGTVRVFWRVKYLTWSKVILNPRLFSFEYRKDKLSWFDGYSVFHVGVDGLVHRIVTQKIMPDDSELFARKPLTELIRKITMRAGIPSMNRAMSEKCSGMDIYTW